jgi:predicted RNase H-like nuclease (RuvC/YqgF family)
VTGKGKKRQIELKSSRDSTDSITINETIQNLAARVQQILSTVKIIQDEVQCLRNEITEIRSEIRSESSRTLTVESSSRAHDDAISKLKESVDNSRLGPLSNKILILENAE